MAGMTTSQNIPQDAPLSLSLYIYKKKALRISATATQLVAIAVMHTDEVLCSYEEK